MAKKTVKITGPVAAKYQLSHNVGDVVEMDAKQATQMIEAGDAVEFKKGVDTDTEKKSKS